MRYDDYLQPPYRVLELCHSLPPSHALQAALEQPWQVHDARSLISGLLVPTIASDLREHKTLVKEPIYNSTPEHRDELTVTST